MIRKLILVIAAAVLSMTASPVFADQEKTGTEKSQQAASKEKSHKKSHKKDKKRSEHEEWMHEKEIRSEIGYFAMKLLEMSDKDEISLSQEPYTKPFLGVCSEITENGVKLTCITPGHNAGKAGLRTGDMVIELNGNNLISTNTKKVKKDYYDVLMNMQTGDVLNMKIMRGSEEMEFKPTVGKLMQPGYDLTIYRKTRK